MGHNKEVLHVVWLLTPSPLAGNEKPDYMQFSSVYILYSIHEDLGNLHYGFIVVPAASNYIHSSTVCILKIFIAVPCAFNIIHSRFIYKWKPRA